MKQKFTTEAERFSTSMKRCQKQWERIGLDDDFLFGKVMQDPKLCKELLQRILPEVKIKRITFPEPQKTIRPDMDAKSVRLDIYVEDEKKVIYDVEIQKVNTKELPKRSRYYQSVLDMQLLEKGKSYRELRKSFVIFICLEDIFGQGRHIYTFENTCKEDRGLLLCDETTKIFLNAAGTKDDIKGELKAFLNYLKGEWSGKKTGLSEDVYIQELDRAVKRAKQNMEWRREYMMLWMRDQENLERGIEQGVERGIRQGIKQGIKQGMKQGIDRGIRQGIDRQRRNTIFKMLRQGFSDEQIKSLCDSSEEEILECRAALKKK